MVAHVCNHNNAVSKLEAGVGLPATSMLDSLAYCGEQDSISEKVQSEDSLHYGCPLRPQHVYSCFPTLKYSNMCAHRHIKIKSLIHFAIRILQINFFSCPSVGVFVYPCKFFFPAVSCDSGATCPMEQALLFFRKLKSSCTARHYLPE